MWMRGAELVAPLRALRDRMRVICLVLPAAIPAADRPASTGHPCRLIAVQKCLCLHSSLEYTPVPRALRALSVLWAGSVGNHLSIAACLLPSGTLLCHLGGGSALLSDHWPPPHARAGAAPSSATWTTPS